MTVTASRSTASRKRARFRPGSFIIGALLIAFSVVMVSPLVWLISTSFTQAGSAFTIPPNWLPIPFTTQNYADIESLIPFGRMFLNSITVAVVSTVGSLFFSVLAAYAFARLSFRGSRLLLVLMLSALMVPAQLIVIPLFVLMRNLGLVDSLAALWLPALINVFQIFFLTQYFRTIPRELDEAATIDGAGHAWILFRMLVPLSLPAISALAILGFESSWNNYFSPLIFIYSPENMTLPLGLVLLQGALSGAPAVVVFAAISAVVFPVLVIFLIFQRAFVSSIASTGLKG